jgi:hypothetical protein
VAPHARNKSGDIENHEEQDCASSVNKGSHRVMKIYDVFRGYTFRPEDIRATIRLWNDGRIEWAYRQEGAEWQRFWWANEVKGEIEQTIRECPVLEEFPVSDLMIRRREG